MIKIDKNVPIPTRLKGHESKYPLKNLKVGESFAIKVDKNTNKKQAATRLRSTVQSQKTNGIYRELLKTRQFVVRCTSKEARVWRIK